MLSINREAVALSNLPKTAISPETTLLLMADLADGQYVPRMGTYLAENIKDQSRLSKSVIIKKPSAIIDRMKNVIAKNKNIKSKIDANHALSQLSGVEKTMYGIGD